MEINWKSGKQWSKDRIFTIRSIGDEEIRIYHLALLINLIAFNERGKWAEKSWDPENPKDFFTPAITEALLMGHNGVDWSQPENTKQVIKWCNEHYLKFSKMKRYLLSVQKKLEDYENE